MHYSRLFFKFLGFGFLAWGGPVAQIGLPCENGFEVLDELAAMRGMVRGIPIVILTGYEHFTYLKQNPELCITDYLTKPCNADRLRRILTQIAHR